MDISTRGTVTWSSPSNIALIKYWGKLPGQFPQNPSLSLTLKEACTLTTLKWERKEKKELEFDFLFSGKRNSKFFKRIETYLHTLVTIFPFIENYKLVFSSENNFPYGAGIASSASAMSSVALCLCSLAEIIKPIDDFYKKASFVARLGSGSAARSVYGGVVSWGDVSSEYASVEEEIHPDILDLKDAILIVDSNEKVVSSTLGHQLMNQHFHADLRFEQAKRNFDEIKNALRQGDWEQIGRIVEAEALELHAMMMTSTPPYILMKPNSLALIEKIKRFRIENSLPIFFTLDAGPNIHLLYQGCDSNMVEKWIKEELGLLCERWILDQVGVGPVRVEE